MAISLEELTRKAKNKGFWYADQVYWATHDKLTNNPNMRSILEFYIDNDLKDEFCTYYTDGNIPTISLLKTMILYVSELETMEIKDIRTFHDTVIRLHKELHLASLDNKALDSPQKRNDYTIHNLVKIIKDALYNEELKK